MTLGAHYGYWIGLALVLLGAVALALVLRARHRDRVFFAALLEQGRREVEIQNRPSVRKLHLHYRPEQTVVAIQQRLSRAWGKRAFGDDVKARIEEALRGVDNKK